MKLHLQTVAIKVLAATLALSSAAAPAQDVLSTRTETQQTTVTTFGAGTTGAGMGVIISGPARPGLEGQTVMQESVVTVVGFQIPDFNPDDLTTHVYHVGLFSETGNGNGSIYFDDNGYGEYELRTFVGETPMRTFLYSVHVDSGEVRAFIDVDNVTVNKAALILTNLALNARVPQGPGLVPLNVRLPGPRLSPVPPPAIGDEYRVSLSGDNVTVEELQEQIFQQTRCNVEAVDSMQYRLVSCD